MSTPPTAAQLAADAAAHEPETLPADQLVDTAGLEPEPPDPGLTDPPTPAGGTQDDEDGDADA